MQKSTQKRRPGCAVSNQLGADGGADLGVVINGGHIGWPIRCG